MRGLSSPLGAPTGPPLLCLHDELQRSEYMTWKTVHAEVNSTKAGELFFTRITLRLVNVEKDLYPGLFA